MYIFTISIIIIIICNIIIHSLVPFNFFNSIFSSYIAQTFDFISLLNSNTTNFPNNILFFHICTQFS